MIVDTAHKAAELLRPFFEAQKGEAVAVLHLDGDRRLLASTFTEAAGVVSVDLPIREILGSALRLGAASLIVAHNHPSGDGRPSEADIAATRRLADAAAAAGVRLTDHFIFAGEEVSSFRALGLI